MIWLVIGTCLIAGAAAGILIMALLIARFKRSGNKEEIAPLALFQQNDTGHLLKENEVLKREAKQYANIMNRSHNPIWVRDANMTLISCNLSFTEVADECDEVEGEEPRTGIDTLELYRGEREQVKQVWEKCEDVTHYQHIVVDGKRRYYKIRYLPSSADQCITGYAVDISEQERAELDIQRHISAQRDLLESSTSAMAIFGADMRLKFFNFSYVTMWKLEEEWLETEPTFDEVLERLRERRALPEQSNFPAFKKQRLDMFKNLIEPEEEFYYLPDGKIIRVIAIPHALGGVLFAYEDVTDRLALERSYNTLIAVQKETLDKLHEGVAVFAENGRLKLTNPAFLTMWQLDESQTVGEPHIGELLDATKDLHGDTDWDEFREGFVSRVIGRKLEASRLERNDGIVMEWSSVPLPDGATLLTFIDVTDSTVVERTLREKNDALEEADKLKTEFLANISYELRSPLTTIMGFSDILLQGYVGELNNSQKEYITGIDTSSKQLNDLIANILDLASMEAGYLQLEKEKFALLPIVDEAVALFSSRMRDKELKLVMSVAKDDSVCGDAQRVKQALFHLLSNAVKYTEPLGTITLRTELDEAGTYIIVEDTGQGIAEDSLPHIFGTFYHNDRRLGQDSGSGLGLSMVKSLVELHGGTVSVESELHQGTCVKCFFPAKEA